MTEVATLAPYLMPLVAPYIPQLVEAAKKVGEKALEKVGENFTDDAWKFSKQILTRLWPNIAAKPAALEAAEDLAKSPDNKSYQTALQVQLEKILAADRELFDEVKRMVEDAGRAGVNTRINVKGDRNVVIGRDNSGVIITGDSNKVEK